MRYGQPREAADIEAEIMRVRRDMEETLSAIEQRLNTDHLMEQALAYVRQSGAREFVSNLGTSVKQNPLSVTLVGIGLAWLMLSGRRAPVPSERELYGYEAGSESPGLQERAGEALSRMSETATAAKERVSATMRTTGRKWSDTGSSVRERARQAMETTRRQTHRARQGFDYMLHEQPLALGAIGLAIGATLAAVMPRTRQEDEWMGDARERLAEQVAETGKEQVHKAREAVSAAGERGAQEASSPQQAQSPTAP